MEADINLADICGAASENKPLNITLVAVKSIHLNSDSESKLNVTSFDAG